MDRTATATDPDGFDYEADLLDLAEQQEYDRTRALVTGLPERPGTLRGPLTVRRL